MKRLPLSLLAHWAGGELIGDDLVIGSLTHDTRTLVPGVFTACRPYCIATRALLPSGLTQSRRSLGNRRRPPLPGRSSAPTRRWPAGIAAIASTTHSPFAHCAARQRGGATRRCATSGGNTGSGNGARTDGGAVNASHSRGSMVVGIGGPPAF